MARLEKQWAKQDRLLGVAPEKAAGAKRKRPEDDAEDEAGGEEKEGPLLPGWEQHWSDEHSCYYYWHKATKQSSWERPAMPVDDDDEAPAPSAATPRTPMAAGAGRRPP